VYAEHHFYDMANISILSHYYKELLEFKREIEELEQEGGILQLKHNNHNGAQKIQNV
jgi:hypothetical protein